MRFPSLSAGCLWLAVLASDLSLAGRAAEAPKAPLNALPLLTELGLADARGAKWVRASVSDRYERNELPGKEGEALEGNAWLVREEPKGRVTLIVNQVSAVHAVAVKEGAEPSDDEAAPGGQPMAQVKPVDVTADLGRLRAGLEEMAQAAKTESQDYETSRRAVALGQALLFVTHLQQQGRLEVESLLLKIVAAGPPQATLDAAVNALAESRLAQVNERWSQTGDAKAYAAELGSLAAQFNRGWTNRGGALLLAGRVRGESVGALSTPAAVLLRGLRPADLSKLPLGTNWILPDSTEGEPAPRQRPYRVIRGRVVLNRPQGKGGSSGPDVESFFQQRVKAASALVPLLGSHETLRLLRGNEGGRSQFYFSSHQHPSEEEEAQRAYGEMVRPYEMGELAAELLQAISPENENSRFERDQLEVDPALGEWVKTLEGKSDEEIAWLYLRTASSPREAAFLPALSYLVEHGSPDSVAKLREVFLDPAVWSEGLEALTEPLRLYVRKLGPDGEAFGVRLLGVVKEEMATNRKEQAASLVDEEMRKRFASQVDEQLKQFEQILHPRTLATLLAEYVATKEDEARTLLEAVRLGMKEEKAGRAESQILQAAAQSTSATGRVQLLGLLMRDPESGGKEAAPPLDAESRAALKKLMADETLPAEQSGERPQTIAETAMYAVLSPRMSEELQKVSGLLYSRAASVADGWARAAVLALAEGQPLPPMPSGPDLKPEEVAELARGWEGKPGAEVLAGVRALPPGRQVGLIGALAKAAQWEAPLVLAQLTIADVRIAQGTEFPAAPTWKGRVFDQKLRDEMAVALRAPALAGTCLVVNLSARHPLSGLDLFVTKLEQKFQRSNFDHYAVPALKKRPPVEATVATFVRVLGRSPVAAVALEPLWKDAALTRAWAAEPRAQPAPADDARRAGQRHDPAALAALVARIEKGEPAAATAFQYIDFASPIVAEGGH